MSGTGFGECRLGAEFQRSAGAFTWSTEACPMNASQRKPTTSRRQLIGMTVAAIQAVSARRDRPHGTLRRDQVGIVARHVDRREWLERQWLACRRAKELREKLLHDQLHQVNASVDCADTRNAEWLIGLHSMRSSDALRGRGVLSLQALVGTIHSMDGGSRAVGRVAVRSPSRERRCPRTPDGRRSMRVIPGPTTRTLQRTSSCIAENS